MNRQKKKNYYQSKLEEYKGYSKKLWKTFNEVIGKIRRSKTSSFIEVDGKLITKPIDIANHFNNYFKCKVDLIRKMR